MSIEAALLPRIALERVNVHLAGRHVLKDVSWSLEADQHWAFVGRNGSGKSTLLRVIAGRQWIDGDGGERRYSSDGRRPDAVGRATTWIRIVSAEQHEHYARLDLGLSGRTIVESGFDDGVYLQRALRDDETARVDHLLVRFDLAPFAGRPLRELSSGQIRRLLIARAFVREPRVLVLDEFTNGLDRAARRETLAFLDRLAPSVALIVASHRTDDFPAAISHTAKVEGGTIVERRPGRPTEFRPSAIVGSSAKRPIAAEVLVDIRGADVYRGHTPVLRDVNWSLRRGQHTAIRGANGSGKSTFAGLVAGTIPAATGARITRFGATEPFDVWKLKERIAHVCDELQIAYDQSDDVEAVIASGFPASIGLFVQPSRAQLAAVDELIERIGLGALRGRTFTQLSFGERRKVLIARSLVRRPTVFILDEVWNGLDAPFRRRLRELLTEMSQAGTTLLAITHEEDDEITALTPRVCTIVDGRIHEADETRPSIV